MEQYPRRNFCICCALTRTLVLPFFCTVWLPKKFSTKKSSHGCCLQVSSSSPFLACRNICSFPIPEILFFWVGTITTYVSLGRSLIQGLPEQYWYWEHWHCNAPY